MNQIPENLKYTSSHEWAKLNEDGSIKVGITERAQSLLGDVVFVELPDVDEEFGAGQECGVIESVKAAADIYCPIPGKIIEVNAALSDSPQLVNQEPYEQGWLFKIKPESTAAFSQLLSAAEYEKQLADEQ